MAYNLLRDTDSLSSWTFTNCHYKDGVLYAKDNYFGISQELVLPDVTKLYFRVKYFTSDTAIESIIVGIQNEDVLQSNRKAVKINKTQHVSVVDVATQEKIKVQVIFKSTKKDSTVSIKEPILCDLNYLHKTTWLKSLLDKSIIYRKGYSYTNLCDTVISKNMLPSEVQTTDAKIGVIVDTDGEVVANIDVDLEVGKYYLAKLDFKEVNNLGNVGFEYSGLKSTRIGEQAYIVFKARQGKGLKLMLKSNDVISYKINLKRILVTDITRMNLMQEDIPCLPFI